MLPLRLTKVDRPTSKGIWYQGLECCIKPSLWTCCPYRKVCAADNTRLYVKRMLSIEEHLKILDDNREMHVRLNRSIVALH